MTIYEIRTDSAFLVGDTPPTQEEMRAALRELAPEVKPYQLSLTVEPEPYIDESFNPRAFMDNESTMACFHKRYTLGDEGHGYNSDDYEGWDEMEEAIQENENPDCILPLRLYDHSGISMSVGTASDWDSGRVGFIWAKKFPEETLEQLEARLRSEVEVYDTYLRGGIYRFTVKDSNGEVMESCTGFYSEEDARLDGEATLKATMNHLLETTNRVAQEK